LKQNKSQQSNDKSRAKQAEEEEVFDAEKLGNWLMQDLRLRTDLRVCAVCSERRSVTELSSEVIEASEIPQGIALDTKGVLSPAPLGNAQLRQLCVCQGCLLNGAIRWKNAIWNSDGLGILPEAYWWSEEALVATISCYARVQHAGGGGHSYKQEGEGSATFLFNNVLALFAALLQDEEILSSVLFCIVFTRPGLGVSTDQKMLVRVRQLLQLFSTLWTTNDLYRRHCLECASGNWTEQRVEEEIMQRIQQRLNQPDDSDQRARERAGHHWPWAVDPTWTDLKTFYVQAGSFVDVLGFEVEVFMRAMPTLFSAVDSEKLAKLRAAMNWKKQLPLEQFAKHVAMLDDNRLGKHDRALFVLNWMVVRARVSAAMLKGFHAISVADGIDNVDAFVQALEQDIAADIQHAKDDKANGRAAAEKNNDDSYKEDSLVRKAINGLKLLARGVLGHPMARSEYRKELKAYHRMLNPGSIWLTINVSDKDNAVLKRMYGDTGLSEYEQVKSGGITQALFFDAYVQSFLDNVLMVGACGVFGAVEWAGGTVEWCVEGRPHLHLIICAARTTPEAVSKALLDEAQKHKLEEWVAETFCESLDHGRDVSVVMHTKMEDGSLLHQHSAVCKKYQTADNNGKVRCRFEYAKQTHQCTNGLKAQLQANVSEESSSDSTTPGWQWKLQRDHGNALCHSDKLFEVHNVCKDALGDIAHYVQFFGSSGSDGQRVISYCTNYTTKAGISRIKVKQVLLDIANEAKAKAALAGDAWGKRDRITWILRCALVQLMQAVAVPQAQAALNVLELREFFVVWSNPNGYKPVPLNSTPFVEFAAGKGVTSSEVEDFLFRGAELADYSVLRLRQEGWRKEEKKAIQKQEQGVEFMSQHPQHATHWLVRKKQFASARLRVLKRDVLVHVLRKRCVVADKDSRETWAKVLAVPFRKRSDLSGNWEEIAEHSTQDKAVAFMKHLLMLEELNAACEQVKGNVEEKRRGDELDGDEQNDWRMRKAVTQSRRGHSDVEMVVVTGVGGEYGRRAVVAAKLAGLLKTQQEEVLEEVQRHQNQHDSNELVLPDEVWKRMRADQVEEEDDEEIEYRLQQKRSKRRFSADEMDNMICSWKEKSERLKRCNMEHLRAVLVCIVYLADVLVGKRNVETFSMVVQGAGGTGKTASVIGAVKEFVEFVANVSGDDSIADCVMVLAPTNLAALAIGGQTLDKGIFNRRGKQNVFQGEGVVKLLLIDEFSMVSCSWIAMIEEALRGNNKASTNNEANLFGGISIVWIGDVHQLPPVFGHAVFSTGKKMTSNDRRGQQLWTGMKWKVRKSLSVVVTQQYRMGEPLAGIAQRFADGKQTVDDAMAVRARLMKRGSGGGAKTEDEWLQKLAQNRAKVLTGENNVKAAINWEIVKALRGERDWLEWKSEDTGGLRDKEEEMGVVDQLEPMQCVWKWMPVICLENMEGGTGVCNGALCWIVHVVADGEPADCKIIVVAANDEAEAREKAETAVNLVELKQVVRDGRRAFPVCPVWAMTLHKVQGATLDEAVIALGRRLCAHSVYMALSRVRKLDCLWLLEAQKHKLEQWVAETFCESFPAQWTK
jgi:hypothetical protein